MTLQNKEMQFLDSHKNELNPEQLKAVMTLNGPVLVLAGAGSGKTRVLTYRIAHLVKDQRVALSQILAMTFSNKAAREMHDRVKALLGDQSEIRFPWISTFHSVCARLLRMYGSKLGYSSDFAIYDEGEQLTLLRSVMENLKISDKEVSPDVVLRRIGEWKNEGITAEGAERWVSQRSDEIAQKIYGAYAEALKAAQAMDFDDLLLLTHELLKSDEDLRARLHAQWRYVLVDEFQDTNTLQYKLLKLLVNESNNLCVVGDDDQSIYGWRGAKVENILNFPKDFEPATVIKLEQNYRSTGNILKAAHAIISKNEMRHAKKLWTSEGPGLKISVRTLPDDRWEARFIVSEIFRLVNQQRVSPSEIAVLYRVNSLSRGFEEECLRQRIPYQIVGGFRFYERKEIKDVLSYLRILLNPADLISWRRSISNPSRGVGDKSLEKLETEALRSGKPLAEGLLEISASAVSGRARAAFEDYQRYLKWGFDALKHTESLVDLFVEALRLSRYVESLEAEKSSESVERVENIRELLSAVQEFEENWQPQSDEVPEPARAKLRDFLERVSLMTDLDQMKATQKLVTFMSLHAAKGLEFQYCFLAGLEEGLLPSSRSFDDYQRSEEERRLCYVGITRAKERLTLTRAERRRTFGSYNFNLPSRFLRDLPPDILEVHVEKDDYAPSSFSYSPRKGRSYEDADDRDDDDFQYDQRPAYREEAAHEDENAAFKRGDRVKHPSFGEGIVQKQEMIGSDPCLNIVFPGKGLKKVLAKFVTKLSIFLVALIPLLSGCMSKQEPVTRLEKLIWSTSLQTWISEAEVLSLARAADVVLLGEMHDNPHHHERQARVISGLRSPEASLVIGFEHIPARLQSALDTYRQNDSKRLSQLGRDLEWEKLGWPNWKLFEPVFEAAFQSGGLVIALDGMVRHGQPSRQDTRAKQVFRGFPSGLRRSLMDELKISHCGKISESSAARMAETQIKRDLNMISRMSSSSPKGAKQIYVVGRGHARKDWGISFHLKSLRPRARVLSIGFLEAMPELQGLGKMHDIVWITPAVKRPDPCAEFSGSRG